MKNYSDNDLVEKLLSREVVLDGKYPFWMDELQMPDGRVIRREHFHHPGGVAVLAVNEEKEIAFVKQYRYPVAEVTEEIPAGKLDKIPNEDLEHAAQRELREETGYVASEIIPLGFIYPSPGVWDEVLHLFFAKGLQKSEQDLDDDEFINVIWLSVPEVEKRIADSTMTDIKCTCAFARAKLRGLLD